MLGKLRKFNDFIGDRMNPITVRELRRNSSGKISMVSYVVLLCLFLGTMLVPDARHFVMKNQLLPILSGFWAFICMIAALSSSSTSIAICWEDPLLTLIPMSARQQVRGYMTVFAIFLAYGTLLPIPLLLINALVAWVSPPFDPMGDPVAVPLWTCLGLVLTFFIGNALAAYLFSFYTGSHSPIERGFASVFAFFSPLVYIVFWAIISADFALFTRNGPGPILTGLFLCFGSAILYFIGVSLAISHFEHRFRKIGFVIAMNFGVYLALNIFLFIPVVILSNLYGQ